MVNIEGVDSLAYRVVKNQEEQYSIWPEQKAVPAGWYEKGFTKATRAIAESVAASKAHAIVGGGDTGLLVEKTLEKTKNKKVFVSTAGGATLDYLGNGTLPGIKALDQK